MRTKLIYVFILFILALFIPHKTSADETSSGSSATFDEYRNPQSLTVILKWQKQDHRAKILQSYLTKAHSPLAFYANEFISAADAYHIPWYLVAAISGTESTFGQETPYHCNNAWGFGIYANQTLCFESYPEAIKKISRSLREEYMNKWGANRIEEIGRLYATSPAWTAHTQYFIDQILSYKHEFESRSIPISL